MLCTKALHCSATSHLNWATLKACFELLLLRNKKHNGWLRCVILQSCFCYQAETTPCCCECCCSLHPRHKTISDLPCCILLLLCCCCAAAVLLLQLKQCHYFNDALTSTTLACNTSVQNCLQCQLLDVNNSTPITQCQLLHVDDAAALCTQSQCQP